MLIDCSSSCLDNTQQGTVGDDVFTVHVSAPVMDALEVKSNITTESEDASYVVQNIHGPFVFLTPQDTAAQNMTLVADAPDTLPDAHDTERNCFQMKKLYLFG
jgi:hypothetical protein